MAHWIQASFKHDSHAQMQAAIELTDATFAQWGLEISVKKTKVMGIGQSESIPAFSLPRGELEAVDAFKYLGSFSSSDATLHKEISHRLSSAGHAYHRLYKLWNDPHIALSVKLSVYKSVVLASLLHGGETWAWTQATIQPLATFHMRCLRKLCRISIRQRVGNSQILRRCAMNSIESVLRFRRLRWLGHMARMGDQQTPKRLLFGQMHTSIDRGPGRPHKSWQDCVRDDLASLNMLYDWSKIAQDRERFRLRIQKLLVHT